MAETNKLLSAQKARRKLLNREKDINKFSSMTFEVFEGFFAVEAFVECLAGSGAEAAYQFGMHR
jgi:hypothetical protein